MKPMSVAGLLVIVLIGVATLLRFVNVADAPPGFYIDEAAISAQVICVRQSGANLQGQHLPLFTQVLGGGFLTPTYLYPAVAWTSAFGDSVSSFRTYTAFFSVLFIIGCYLLGLRFWKTQEAAILCALSAACSPWVFQFARIAWDPSIAPAYMVWAFALLFVPLDSRYRKTQLAISGVLFSAAAYAYPPLRVQLAITLPLAFFAPVFRDSENSNHKGIRDFFIPVVTATLASLPLLQKTVSGELQGRFQMLSVFNAGYLQQTYGSTGWFDGVHALLSNFVLLLSPAYLFVQGDANLRHSTGSFGVWSWLDCLGLFGALLAGLMILTRRSKQKAPWFEILFCAIGYLAGLLPAALTWESNPHALRSFGAVTFLILAVGGGLHCLWCYSRTMRSAIIGMAFASFLIFVHVYFTEYPSVARIWFDADVTDLAKQLDQENRLKDLSDVLRSHGVSYDPMAVAYYQLAGGAIRCPLLKNP